MGAMGALIMGFFGATFAEMSLILGLHLSGAVLSLPFLAFAAVAVFAVLTLRLPGQGVARSKHAKRVILWSTLGEGLGLFVAANLVVNFGNQNILIPTVAIVVGFHFIPMARGIPFPPFYTTGFALILPALVGLLVPQPAGGELSGFAAAAVLMVSSLVAVQRDRRLKLG